MCTYELFLDNYCQISLQKKHLVCLSPAKSMRIHISWGHVLNKKTLIFILFLISCVCCPIWSPLRAAWNSSHLILRVWSNGTGPSVCRYFIIGEECNVSSDPDVTALRSGNKLLLSCLSDLKVRGKAANPSLFLTLKGKYFVFIWHITNPHCFLLLNAFLGTLKILHPSLGPINDLVLCDKAKINFVFLLGKKTQFPVRKESLLKSCELWYLSATVLFDPAPISRKWFWCHGLLSSPPAINAQL